MLKYTVDSYLENLAKFKVSHAIVAPPILVSLLKNNDKVKQHDLSTVKIVRSGSAPLTIEI